jgi:CDP-diacylglycerol--glycerol-3-phosphate 3-phosphatidyltransferase
MDNEKTLMQNRILTKSTVWTTSNMLSFLRGLLAIPVGVALWHNNALAVILIGVMAVITDLLDGYLARHLNQISEAGKIIDPLADKIFVGTCALILIIQGRMPLWFGIAVMARDLLIMLGGLFATSKIKYVIPSNYPGKITVLLLVCTMLSMLLDFEVVKEYLMYAALAAMVISLTIYFVNMMNKIRAQKLENRN